MIKSIELDCEVIAEHESLLTLTLDAAGKVSMDFNATFVDNSFDHAFGRRTMHELVYENDTISLTIGDKVFSCDDLKRLLSHTCFDALESIARSEVDQWIP